MSQALREMLVYNHEQDEIPALRQLLDCEGFMV